jgi:hypothetical protein
MNTTQKKLIEFFASHPGASVVYVALGNLFTDLEKATKYCGGTKARPETYSREQVIVPEETPVTETQENLTTVTAGDSQPGTTTGEESSVIAANNSNSNQSSPQDAGISEEEKEQSVSSNEQLANEEVTLEVVNEFVGEKVQIEEKEINGQPVIDIVPPADEPSEEIKAQMQIVEECEKTVAAATKKADQTKAKTALTKAKNKLAEMQGLSK